MSPAEIHVGTSGWHYDHWSGSFYPEDLSKSEWLDYYAERFRTVEINNTFYQMPEEKTLRDWCESVSPEFFFAVKVNRYTTHMKKLKDPEEHVPDFLERVEVLGDQLGPLLFQLPPRWHRNVERLRELLELLPGTHRYAFEFRDPDWFDEATYAALEEYGAALCVYQLAGRKSPLRATADFVYVRLHGPTDRAYEGRYGTEGLEPWAGACRRWAEEGRTVYVYFDNDQAGYAVEDARRLREMLD